MTHPVDPTVLIIAFCSDTAVGLRVFEPLVNGVNQGEVDIVNLAPGSDTAYVVSTTATDNNGVIAIALKNLVENPKISGIEIVQL